MKLQLPSQNKKLNYDYKINIDTIVMRAKLSHEQIDSIFDYFYYRFKRTKKYYYNLYLREYGIAIQIHPTEPTLHTYFNATITLTPAFFNIEYIPYSILDMIKNLPLSITRIDIATDFPYTYSDNVLLFKNHGNQKEFIYRNESKYVGSKTSRLRAISYNRNEKETARGNKVSHTYSNRVEVRIRFKMDEQPINKINHDEIIDRLLKVIYIPSINNLRLDGWTKNSLRKIHNKHDLIKELKRRERDNLKKYLRHNRAPLEEYYSNNIDSIYNFLTYREHQQQQAI